MIVFKTFWNVINKYKGTIILYSIMLIVFGALNFSTNNNQMTFENTKPDILIKNNDSSNVITNNLINYMESNSNIVSIKDDEESTSDALFYRDVNYIIYIPSGYGEDVIKGLNPEINIKSTGDYNASLSEMMLTRYIKIQNIYQSVATDQDELVKLINNNLKTTSNISVSSKLDTTKLSNLSRYFSFASYSIMAVVIFIICLVLSSFKEKNINKRTIISSKNYKALNKELLIASFTYSLLVWLLYIILGIALNGEIMFTSRGILYILNSLIFTFCALTIALLISTLINNKNAINGIVNVVALGSAFLCGAFVPAEWLPDGVLKIAHILPSYWYINTNDLLKQIEVINRESLLPIIINCLVLIGFALLFIIINNIVSHRKQKID